MSWLSWLRPAAKKESPSVIAAAPASSAVVPVPADDVPHFLTWLLDGEPPDRSELSSQEQRALCLVQETLSLPSIPLNLLPRASALLPQLIALLRESTLPHRAIAERISKDAKLTAEVMRVANNAHYRSQEDVTNLVQAIARIGTLGLQSAIARVVLKPILQGSASPQLAALEQRLWEYSELLAQHAAALAPSSGLPGIDGYLAGMLHCTGWKVAVRSLDQADMVLDPSFSQAFAHTLTEQSHHLFGMTTQGWDITPGFSSFATDACQVPLHKSKHPMTRVLLSAQALTMQELATGMEQTLPAPLTA